jgi:hypothetical protein
VRKGEGGEWRSGEVESVPCSFGGEEFGREPVVGGDESFGGPADRTESSEHPASPVRGQYNWRLRGKKKKNAPSKIADLRLVIEPENRAAFFHSRSMYDRFRPDRKSSKEQFHTSSVEPLVRSERNPGRQHVLRVRWEGRSARRFGGTREESKRTARLATISLPARNTNASSSEFKRSSLVQYSSCTLIGRLDVKGEAAEKLAKRVSEDHPGRSLRRPARTRRKRRVRWQAERRRVRTSERAVGRLGLDSRIVIWRRRKRGKKRGKVRKD